jgi:plasmid segregation protein ParM
MFYKKNVSEKEFKLIAIDPGKYLTKSVMGDNRDEFRTKVTFVDTFEDVSIQGNSFKLEFENQKMIIGDQGCQGSYEVSKKSLLHKMAVYASIVRLLGNNLENSIIQAVVSCPISIYKDGEQRKKYKEYIYNNGTVNMNINNIKYNIIFDDKMLIIPEGAGVSVKFPKSFSNKRIALIDIGGLNMNFSIYDDCIFDMNQKNSFTRNMGNISLENDIINVLDSKFATDINNEEAVYILREGGLKHQGVITNESAVLIDDIKNNFINKINDEILKSGFDLQKMDIVFIGGTSLLLEKEIYKKYPHSLVLNEAQWAHVSGALEIGRVAYDRK